ncbi:MAG: N-acetyl sugar amidotransferase, partial [Bacteroidales bacterium]
AENLPCIIIESFCCGRPVLSNSVNGVVELINETNGLMSAPRDIEAFSKNICHIIENAGKYDLEKIAINAQSLFYPEVVGKLIYETYRKTLSVKPAREYQMCSHCIMDTNDDPDISFDANGVCNYCKMYERFSKEIIHRDSLGKKQMLEIINKIKDKGKNKKYDSILGVSGGVDSTYTAYLAKQYGLRPLLVHLDNGWNSELAMSNIEYVVSKLGFDLHTWVINWEEFKDIQLSFLKASVVDIELVTDYAIVASLYLMAAKHKIDYIITGHNFATEGIMPMNWVHWKSDLLNIESIHNRYGKEKISTFPQMGYFRKAAYVNLYGIRTFPILNFANYNKDEAKAIVVNELGWRDYGGKHNESLFTKFYQSYILPKKFNIDKRKAHLSTLICSGQTTKEKALAEMKNPPFVEDKIAEDKKYIIKKFDLTDAEFEKIMNTPIRQHTDFPSYAKIHYKYELMILGKLKPLSKPLKKYFGLRGRTNYV